MTLLFLLLWSLPLPAAAEDADIEQTRLSGESFGSLELPRKVSPQSVASNLVDKRERLSRISKEQQSAYFGSLQAAEQQVILRELARVRESKEALTRLDLSLPERSDAGDRPKSRLLLVHGLYFVESEFFEPFHLALQSGRETYFFRFSRYESFSRNVRGLKAALARLIRESGGAPIDVVAHCTGGVMSIVALDEITSSGEATDTLRVVAVAAPVNGYNAPDSALSYLGAPFVGPTTISIGIGLGGKLHSAPLSHCEQWITTNCDLDIHACPRDNGYPQRLAKPPCGPENLHELPDTTHHGALTAVLRRLLTRLP